MATTVDKFDSKGGFSVEKVIHIDELHNAKELNSLEIKNSFYSDSTTTNYILRGLNTAILQLDDVGTKIPIANSTINFVTGNIIGVNPQAVVKALKIESVVYCDGSGNVSILSSMVTTIKDDVPSGQSWDVAAIGSANNFSYTTTRAGTTNTIKWIASTQVVSIDWV